MVWKKIANNSFKSVEDVEAASEQVSSLEGFDVGGLDESMILPEKLKFSAKTAYLKERLK